MLSKHVEPSECTKKEAFTYTCTIIPALPLSCNNEIVEWPSVYMMHCADADAHTPHIYIVETRIPAVHCR